MTNSVDHLEAVGLVKRRPDPTDGRGSLISLTARGRRVALAAFADSARLHGEAFSVLNDDERNLLDTLLGKVINHLDQLEGDAGA